MKRSRPKIRPIPGKISVFTRSVGIFHSISLGGTGVKRFVVQASEGEVEPPSFTWPDKQKPRVCILGGGFGGLYTALRLDSLVWPEDKKPQVLLVDQSDRFVFKPLLYELLSGEVDAWEIAPLFTDLLKDKSVQFVKDKVKFLHPCDHLNHPQTKEPGRPCSGGTVHLESGIIIEYDCQVSIGYGS